MCRTRGIKQIGNVGDWVAIDPGIFIGSAVADVRIAVFNAIRAYVDGSYRPGTFQRIGLANPDAVRLTLHPDVSPSIKQELEKVSLAIQRGEIDIPTRYEGPEFLS